MSNWYCPECSRVATKEYCEHCWKDQTRQGFKLLHLRKNGTLGPLFINCRQVIPIGVWLQAECHPKKGYALRPGWHATATPDAPHLSMKDRVWARVDLHNVTEWKRPRSQGGMWWLAEHMCVLSIEDQL